MTKLSVNVNKIATLRNARGGNTPNVVKMAQDIERFGANGITVHPRPDERHITQNDVYALAEVNTTEFNIEGYPNERFLQLIKEVKPTQVTLVPDPPHVLTSNAGWDTEMHFDLLEIIVGNLKEWGVRTSIFIEPDQNMLEHAAKIGVDRVEFYTGPYADNFKSNSDKAVEAFSAGAKICTELGIGLNAGHDLDLNNLNFFKNNVENLLEVSIGHALVSDALYLGMENTIEAYLKALK